MAKMFLGLDLGGTSVKAGVVDAHGKLLGTGNNRTGPEPAKAVVAAMVAAGKAAVDSAGLKLKDIAAVGVVSPGQTRDDKGIVIRAANFPAWRNVKLRAMVTTALGVPGVLENDAKAAAYGEWWAGAGKNKTIENLAIITLGTGIGGGVVHRGNILRGSHGFAAEIGHMIIAPGGVPCGCGQRGCFEMYASAKNVGLRAAALAKKSRDKKLLAHIAATGPLTAKDVQDHATRGNKVAQQIWNDTCHSIALAAVNVIHHFDPDILVLGGGMSKAGDFLLAGVHRHFEELWWKMTPPTCNIVISRLGGDAGMVGAAGVAKLAWERDDLPEIGH